MVGDSVMLGDKGKYKSVFLGKHEGKRPLGRTRRGFEENTSKKDFRWDGRVDWIYVTQGRDKCPDAVNTLLNLRDL